MTYQCSHISITVTVSPEKVYEYIFNPENLPAWAPGFCRSISKFNEEWIADSPLGKVKVKFAPDNSFGVLDHQVTLPSGEIVNNPMRIIPNEGGSEIIFTLFRLPDMTDKMFENDFTAVTRDLKKLKDILEAG